MRVNINREDRVCEGGRITEPPKSPACPDPPSLGPEEDGAVKDGCDEDGDANESLSSPGSSPLQLLNPVGASPEQAEDEGDRREDSPYWSVLKSSVNNTDYSQSNSKAQDRWKGSPSGAPGSLSHRSNYPHLPDIPISCSVAPGLSPYSHHHHRHTLSHQQQQQQQQIYTSCSSTTSSNSIPGLYQEAGDGGGGKSCEESGAAGYAGVNRTGPSAGTAEAAAAHYLSVPPLSLPPADMSIQQHVNHNRQQVPSGEHTPLTPLEDAQFSYLRRPQHSHPPTHNQHIWPSGTPTPPTSSSSSSTRPPVDTNPPPPSLYTSSRPCSKPPPAAATAAYDAMDGGGLPRGPGVAAFLESETPEALEESLEEIAELEGELSSEEEAEEEQKREGCDGDGRTSRQAAPFEGINFAQLFSASAAHSEQLIALAKQFYPKLRECLILATNEMARPRDLEPGYHHQQHQQQYNCNGGLLDSPLENVLCKLTSMLEECLFHMVDWVNRTEIFRVIPVEDKMQLLYSSWSEVIVIEFLQCVIFHFRNEDRPQETMKMDPMSPGPPSNRDLYCLVKDLLRYLLPPASDANQRIWDLLARFDVLRVSVHEFTCLKFLVIFNPHKHDVHINLSYDYVRLVQSELCQFLLRAARRAAKRRGVFTAAAAGSPPPAFMATAEGSERLGQLLAHLADVKHIAFTLESFLVARYYASCIPNESLLTEMLLTKRGRPMPPPPTPQPPPPPPPPPASFTSSAQPPQGGYPSMEGATTGFAAPLQPNLSLKRNPSEYAPLPPPPHHVWRARESEYQQQQQQVSLPTNQYFPASNVPKYLSHGQQQQQTALPQQEQHQRFFMGSAQSQSHLQDQTFVPPHTSASVI